MIRRSMTTATVLSVSRTSNEAVIVGSQNPAESPVGTPAHWAFAHSVGEESEASCGAGVGS